MQVVNPTLKAHAEKIEEALSHGLGFTRKDNEEALEIQANLLANYKHYEREGKAFEDEYLYVLGLVGKLLYRHQEYRKWFGGWAGEGEPPHHDASQLPPSRMRVDGQLTGNRER